MTLENIMTTDAMIGFANSFGPLDIVYTGDVPTTYPGITAFPCVSCRAPSNAALVCIYHVVCSFNPANPCPHTSATCTFNIGNVVIFPSATKVRANGELVMRENDENAIASGGTGCMGDWTEIATGAIIKCQCDAKIAYGGQSKAKAQ